MDTRVINQDKSTIENHGIRRRPTVVMGQSEKRSTDRTVNIICGDNSSSTKDKIALSDQRPKIAGIKDGITTFIVNSSPTAQVAVLTFSDDARILFDLQPRGTNPSNRIQQVQQMNPGGRTAMCAALMLAGEVCKKAPTDIDAIRIYLLSDGIQTDGNPIPIADQLKRSFSKLQIHCIGFGEGDQLDMNTLRNIASRSNSGDPFYYHCKDAEKLTGVLKRQSRNLYT